MELYATVEERPFRAASGRSQMRPLGPVVVFAGAKPHLNFSLNAAKGPALSRKLSTTRLIGESYTSFPARNWARTHRGLRVSARFESNDPGVQKCRGRI